MAHKALAGYIKTLRGNLTLRQVVERTGGAIDIPFLQRIEKGDNVGWLGAVLVVEALEGNCLDLPELALPNSDYDDGVEIANAWIEKRKIPPLERAESDRLLDELEQDGTLDLIRHLRISQIDYAQWLGVGRGLVLKSGS